MSIEADPTTSDAASRTFASPRPTDLAAIWSPGQLLRPGDLADPRTRPECALALDALRLGRLLRSGCRPGRWPGAAFGRRVDAVRAHLAPFRDRPLLAASLGREALLGARLGPGSILASPVRVAYAVRWLELAAGEELPAWGELVATDVRTD
jgi:hypothetical protein